MATHSRILDWKFPWTEEPSGLQSMGSQRAGHDWVHNTHTQCIHHVQEWASMTYLILAAPSLFLGVSCSAPVEKCPSLRGLHQKSWRPHEVSSLWVANKYVVIVVQWLCHATPWDPMDCSTPDSSVLHNLPEFAQIHVHQKGHAIWPSHPLSPLSPFAFSLFQCQSLLQWVVSSNLVAKL